LLFLSHEPYTGEKTEGRTRLPVRLIWTAA